MKIPIHKSAVPSVDQPYDPSANSNSIAPDHKNEHNVGYCNILPPAPRSQLVSYPPRSTMCPKINPKGYTKDSCYLVNNVDQGVVGLVCNNAGGSDNSNFVRGNEFSNDFYWVGTKHKEDEYNLGSTRANEYVVERPVQVPLEKSNPTMIYAPSNFYPMKARDGRKKYPWYRTYPQFKNYAANGLPIYTYPYPIPKKDEEIVEGFSNNKVNLNRNDYVNLTIMIAIVVLLILAITYFL